MLQLLDSDSEDDATASAGCGICLHLEQIFNGSTVEKTFPRWDLHTGVCTDHDAFLDYIRTVYYSRKKMQLSAGLERWCFSIWGWKFGREHEGIPWAAGLDHTNNKLGRYQLLYQPRDTYPEKVYSTCISTIQTSWVDFRAGKEWLRKCVTEHTSKCQRPPGFKHVSPAWLIDTKENRLVPGNGILDFVALSYRWGSSKHQKMDLTTFKRMMSPGGLASARHAGILTPTVSDAIQTVRAISERYLWTDAICLAPDDKEVMIEQLQLMGAIYASAKLTIVALDGDSATGLAGTADLPRSLENSFEWKDGSRILVRSPPALSATDSDASEYFRRGWTFQEYTLSRRRLIFAKQQIHWTCSCSYWHEDCPNVDDGLDKPDDRLDVARFTRFPGILAGFPDFEELNNLINEYNGRELSYAEDAFPGIMGLLDYIDIAFKGGFLFGLPKASFDAALMWDCSFKEGLDHRSGYPRSDIQRSGLHRSGIHRRKPSITGGSILPNAALPSWSWVGWKGSNINILQDESRYLTTEIRARATEIPFENGSEFSRCRRKVITIPITQWFGHKSADWNTKDPITPDLEDLNTAPPSFDATVWKKIEFDPYQHSGDEEGYFAIPPWGINGAHVYEHVDLPGQFYWQPPADHNIMREYKSTNHLESRYISCRTERLRLAAVFSTGWVFELNLTMHLKLCDKQGKVCGWLRLQDANDLAEFQAAANLEGISTGLPMDKERACQDTQSDRENVLEVVAICLRKFPGNRWKVHKRELNYHDYYGVLWVKWVDGIAYRHGCGYVRKEMWDEQEPEVIDLILG